MRVKDTIYGEFDITEPLLIELINSKPVQRLKGINQGGPINFYEPQMTVTRYEHSIGVMLLLRKLGASIQEQAAGLLHDVAHTAFSHVVDHVYKDNTHSYHDRQHKNVVEESEIPSILQQHAINIEQLMERIEELLEL